MNGSQRELDLDPRTIQWPHTPFPGPKVTQLTESMRSRGWSGRRLLVEALPDGRYQAWTGSNRLAAARAAGLPTIPVLLIDTTALEMAGNTRHRYGGTFEANCCYYEDDDDERDPDERKLEVLSRADDVLSAQLMTQEIEARGWARVGDGQTGL